MIQIEKEEIIEEFHNIAIAQDYISQGGIGYAKQVLEKALGTRTSCCYN